MALEFCLGDRLSTTIIVLENQGQRKIREVNLPRVLYKELVEFRAKYGLSPRWTARIAISLDDMRDSYDVLGREYPSDRVVVQWLEKIEKSVARIGAAMNLIEFEFEGEHRSYESKYVLALLSMSEAAKNWSLNASGEELIRSGFCSPYDPKHQPIEMYPAIHAWFQHSIKIRDFVRDAKKSLLRRNRYKDGFLRGVPSHHRVLYAIRLPDLYRRYSGRRFGISKNADQKVRYATGVAFVVDAAKVIGLTVKPATVASHFHELKRSFRVGRPSKKVTPATRQENR